MPLILYSGEGVVRDQQAEFGVHVFVLLGEDGVPFGRIFTDMETLEGLAGRPDLRLRYGNAQNVKIKVVDPYLDELPEADISFSRRRQARSKLAFACRQQERRCAGIKAG